MVKLFVSDVDGTLLPHGEDTIDKNIINAIGRLLEKNINVSIASGRSYTDLCRLFADYKDKIYFICCDGAYSVIADRLLTRKPVSMESALRFIKHYSDTAECLAFYGMKNCYVLGNEALLPNENTVKIKSFYDITEQIYKLGAYGGTAREASLVPADMRFLRQKFGCVEYVSRYADKCVAVSELQTRLFLSGLDTAALGNDVNDIKMLKNAKYSAAIKGSEREVVDAAGGECESGLQFIDGLLK